MNNKIIHSICSLFILLVMLGMSNSALAQNIAASGKVVDKNQEPIIGASIVVKGTTNGTVTDMDGNFRLNCAQGSTLEISFVGYVARQVKAGTNLSITLEEDAIMLEEAVIVGVGYGTMRKSDLTGSIHL